MTKALDKEKKTSDDLRAQVAALNSSLEETNTRAERDTNALKEDLQESLQAFVGVVNYMSYSLNALKDSPTDSAARALSNTLLSILNEKRILKYLERLER